MNRKVYAAAFLLILLAAGLIFAKVSYGGHTFARRQEETGRHLWRINIVMNITGKGERAKVRLTLPKDNERQTIYNEHFENDVLVFYIRERPVSGNRIGFWRSELLDGSKTLEYTFSARLGSLGYDFPKNLEIPLNPLTAYPPEAAAWLDASKFIQKESLAMKRQLRRLVDRERKAGEITKRIYDFVRGEVEYRPEKGSKSARQTLDRLVADCGGKARLFAALSRAAGIPSRVVGGIIMTGGAKNITHVWAENYIGGKWVPFDVVNGHYANLPNDYLELYRGDYYLFKHVGLEAFDYLFFISAERMPPVDNPWSLYALPVHFQALIKVILLIPVGALVVAFFRSVIGVPTFGTFAPVLLALAFREISPGPGLGCLAVIVVLGWGLRSLLDHFKILVIPRLSIIVTMVVILVIVMMIVGFRVGQQRILYISLFPFIIMTWLIERFSVIQIEDGLKAALKALLGTTLVAVSAYAVMRVHNLRTYLFAFPELLFVVMALLLVLGRYTGIRFTELWRFREFNRAGKEA